MTKDELTVVLQEHKLWLRREGGQRADLSGANLSGVDLCRADLSRADLRRVNLYGVDLSRANLSRADLSRANLSRANLTGVNLYRVNLYGVDLCRADLSRANLRRANLSRANLTGVNLTGADLTGADLSGTGLDGPIPRPTEQEILEAGLEILEGWVYGYRTERSQHCGNTHYTPGVYTAILSRDTTKACHPGIYLASESWLHANYPDVPIVRCRCRIDHLVHAGDKWRTDELEVLG